MKGFPWTLQRYIFREMGKTFLLTAIALTGVLGLGGGVMNMIKLGDVTTGQLIRLISLVVPISAALTLPIAALFSAAATYGRLSADNEFVACRSSGINMHVLFFPTAVLSLVSATVTFALTSFVIPRMVRNLNEFVGADVGSLIQRRLSRPRGITLQREFRIHADSSYVDPENANCIDLEGVSFIKTDGDEWAHIGVAKQVRLLFDRREKGYYAKLQLQGISAFDRTEGQFSSIERQEIESNEIPLSVPEEVNFLTLRELLYYRSRPMEWRKVQSEVRSLQAAVGRRLIYDALWEKRARMTLAGDRVRFLIHSKLAARVPDDGGIELHNVEVTESGDQGDRRYVADRALVEVKRGSTIRLSQLTVELFNVIITDGPRQYRRERRKLTPVPIPDDLAAQIEALPAVELMRTAADEPADSPVSIAQKRVSAVEAETVRRIAATISERFAFSVSVFVLVLLGAALGIVFRGAHAVTAFGVSFVPSLIVIVTIVMGKQMAYNEATPVAGLLVMWSGIVVVAGLDGWTLTRVLRR